MVLATFTASDWLENFRMNHETFLYLCNQLRPAIVRVNTRFRSAVPVKQQVAITLWCLATPAEYKIIIAHLFGVGRSTVCEIVHETCNAIVDILLPQYISFPRSDHQVQSAIDNFLLKWNIPQCVGAIDGSQQSRALV